MCTAARTISASPTAMPIGCRIVRTRDFWRIWRDNERAGRKVPRLSPRRHRVERVACGGFLRHAYHRLDGEHRHLLLEAFEGELAERLDVEAAHHAVERVLRDHQLARLRDAPLEARGDIHRSAEHGVVDALLRAHVAD